MVTTASHHSPHGDTQTTGPRSSDPTYQAYAVLRTAFVLAPNVFGLDKFTNILVHWEQYLAPVLSQPLPVTPQQAMYAVGVIEVGAGLLVAFHPRLGALVVAIWLGGIILILVLLPGFYDVALRDLGLLMAAVALQCLATRFHPRPTFLPLQRH